jgi:hypothetical protein
MIWLELLDGNTHSPLIVNMSQVVSIIDFQGGSLLITAAPQSEGPPNVAIHRAPPHSDLLGPMLHHFREDH